MAKVVVGMTMSRNGFVGLWYLTSAPGGTRTPNLLIRSQTLYPN
jgi:hypothetical protein